MNCRHCGRSIVHEGGGVWVDPEATGDDSVWRETCDSHDTFTAEHEPEVDGYDPTCGGCVAGVNPWHSHAKGAE